MKIQNQIFLAAALGLFMGLLLHFFQVPPHFYSFLDWFGKLFIRLLKMVAVPLIVASLVVGVISLKTTAELRAMGIRTLCYFLSTTFIAVVIGLSCVNLIRPGVGVEIFSQESPAFERQPIGEMILEFVPDNIFAALAKMEFVPIILFSLFLGVLLISLKGKGKPIADFFVTLNEMMLLGVDWVMKLAPFGVFALLASVVAKMGFSLFVTLGKYMMTVVMGLLLHGVIVLPVLFLFLARRNIASYLRAMLPALSTAFSTSSSAATLPLTIECAQKEGKISKQTAGFVLPLGATMNMDGTALYEAVAAVFIAQVYGIALSLGDQLLIVVTATLASVGAAAIPSAGLVTMAIVLNAVGLPLEGIALIVGVDRLLDMCRTTVNVWGDSVGAAIVDRQSGWSYSSSGRG